MSHYSIYIDYLLAQYHFYRAKDGTPCWKRLLADGLEKALLRYRIRLVEPFGPELGPEITAFCLRLRTARWSSSSPGLAVRRPRAPARDRF